MDKLSQRHTVTFVVRVWAEYLRQTPPIWRGEVKNIDNGSKTYFRQAGDIMDFIEAQVSEIISGNEELPDRVQRKEES